MTIDGEIDWTLTFCFFFSPFFLPPPFFLYISIYPFSFHYRAQTINLAGHRAFNSLMAEPARTHQLTNGRKLDRPLRYHGRSNEENETQEEKEIKSSPHRTPHHSNKELKKKNK